MLKRHGYSSNKTELAEHTWIWFKITFAGDTALKRTIKTVTLYYPISKKDKKGYKSLCQIILWQGLNYISTKLDIKNRKQQVLACRCHQTTNPPCIVQNERYFQIINTLRCTSSPYCWTTPKNNPQVQMLKEFSAALELYSCTRSRAEL